MISTDGEGLLSVNLINRNCQITFLVRSKEKTVLKHTLKGSFKTYSRPELPVMNHFRNLAAISYKGRGRGAQCHNLKLLLDFPELMIKSKKGLKHI